MVVRIAEFSPAGFVVPAVSFPVAMIGEPPSRLEVRPPLRAEGRYGLRPVDRRG